MKIGLVCSESFALPGGIQEQVKGLYKFLKSRGYEVKIIIPKYQPTENYGDDVIFLGIALVFEVAGTKANWSFVATEEEIDEVLNREKFDIIHFHGWVPLFMPLQILERTSAKVIVTRHVLTENSMTTTLFSSITDFMSKKGLRHFFISRFVKVIPDKSFPFMLFSKFAKFFMKENFHKIAKITVPSKPVLNSIVKEPFLQEYKRKATIIPNGFDLKRFSPKNPKIERFLDGKLNILFVGRLDKRKGLDYLIKAYENVKKKYDNLRLIIVGEGYFREDCEELIEERKIKDVVFEGYVDDKDLPKYYATCDIFCSPSIHGESFGLTVIEAMATGKPVAATKIIGYENLLRNGNVAILVKPKSVIALTKALSELIENENLRKRLGKRGLKFAKKFSWDTVGEQFLKVYKDVLSKS